MHSLRLRPQPLSPRQLLQEAQPWSHCVGLPIRKRPVCKETSKDHCGGPLTPAACPLHRDGGRAVWRGTNKAALLERQGAGRGTLSAREQVFGTGICLFLSNFLNDFLTSWFSKLKSRLENISGL